MTLKRFALATVVGFGGLVVASTSASQSVSISPSEGLFDAPFDVVVEGLPPGERVTIRATRRTETGVPWSASGVYISDETGSVKSVSSPSVGGTFEGNSPHGLVCAALPVEPGELDRYIADFSANPRQPRAFAGGLGVTPIEITAAVDGKVVAATAASRSYAKGTSAQEITGPEGWKGLYFPAANGVNAGVPVVVLAGSGGGVYDETAALLASHGHPTLALAMFRYPGLPDSLVNYPIERVRDAAVWLAGQSGTKRAVAWGVSRGSEAASLAAIHFPDAFAGVVAVVPSHLADAGALGPAAKPGDSAWSIGGNPTKVTDLGFSPDDARIAEQARTLPGYNASAMVLEKWASEELDAQYGIPFERLTVPILVLAAAEDAVWPSWISAEHIRRRLANQGRDSQVTVHVYPEAGHSLVALGSGTILSTFTYHPLLQGFLALGGQANGNCEASFQSVEDTLSFLDGLAPSQ